MFLKVNAFEVEVVIMPRMKDYCLYLHIPRLFSIYWDNHLGRHFGWLWREARREAAEEDDDGDDGRMMTPNERRAQHAWKVHPRVIISSKNQTQEGNQNGYF